MASANDNNALYCSVEKERIRWASSVRFTQVGDGGRVPATSGATLLQVSDWNIFYAHITLRVTLNTPESRTAAKM